MNMSVATTALMIMQTPNTPSRTNGQPQEHSRGVGGPSGRRGDRGGHRVFRGVTDTLRHQSDRVNHPLLEVLWPQPPETAAQRDRAHRDGGNRGRPERRHAGGLDPRPRRSSALTEQVRANTWLMAGGSLMLVVVTVIIFFTVFLARETLETQRQVRFIDSVTHELKARSRRSSSASRPSTVAPCPSRSAGSCTG